MNALNFQRHKATASAIAENPTPRKFIYRLNNSLYFFIEIALIVIEESSYRLIVYDKRNNFLVDKHYGSVKGAKNAFIRLFRHNYYNRKPVTEWSYAYPPDTDWLGKIETSIASLPAHYKKRTVKKK